jgi:hypothetical protein
MSRLRVHYTRRNGARIETNDSPVTQLPYTANAFSRPESGQLFYIDPNNPPTSSNGTWAFSENYRMACS